VACYLFWPGNFLGPGNMDSAPSEGGQGMDISDVSSEEAESVLQDLLVRKESPKLEFKRVSGEMVAKALRTVCAFANTRGGFLVLGVGDLKAGQGRSRLYGIEENPEAVDELFRKFQAAFVPEISGLVVWRLPCLLKSGPAKGQVGNVLLVEVLASAQVHSVIDGGTYTRGRAGSRVMVAREITELSYRRGERSASSDVVNVSLDLLETDAWQLFVSRRGRLTGSFPDQLFRLGLAAPEDGRMLPRRAAVLLFADAPGRVLAAFDSRAEVRVMVYDGVRSLAASVPNLRKPAKTIGGPLIHQIEETIAIVMDELAQGLTLSRSGFQTRHAYPERVLKEAIVNAVIHRDYRLNRDIFVRIFDDRVEVESPGLLPGIITPANIAGAGSMSRNPLVTVNLREFPNPPNIDAGEGVPMMFAEMSRAALYPPQYFQTVDKAVQTVTVVLLNAKRPTTWAQVSDWVDRHGSIANADLVRIAATDTLKASKQLTAWREQGLLVALAGRSKRNTAYTKPGLADQEGPLLSGLRDNNRG